MCLCEIEDVHVPMLTFHLCVCIMELPVKAKHVCVSLCVSEKVVLSLSEK